jgi:hypothetical protein
MDPFLLNKFLSNYKYLVSEYKILVFSRLCPLNCVSIL